MGKFRKYVGISRYPHYTYNSIDLDKPVRHTDRTADKKFGVTPYYFAYGSNLNFDQMSGRCPSAEHIGNTIIDDWRLVFRGVADIEPHEGSQVVGGVFKIQEQDELALDRYENYPYLYDKDFFDATVDGETVKVMYYYMTNTDGIGKPPVQYYRTIYDGYIDCGLELAYLETAYKYTISNIQLEGTHYPKRYKKKGKKNAKKSHT